LVLQVRVRAGATTKRDFSRATLQWKHNEVTDLHRVAKNPQLRRVRVHPTQLVARSAASIDLLHIIAGFARREILNLMETTAGITIRETPFVSLAVSSRSDDPCIHDVSPPAALGISSLWSDQPKI
jgi:hypothetical protein